MGCATSCFLVDDNGGHEHSNAPGSRICICFRCLTHPLVSAYTILFQRAEVQVVPLSIQGTASVSASAVEGGSLSNTYHPPPPPLAYDDPRCSSLHQQHVGKASRHSYEEYEPVRRNNDSNIEPMGTGDKRNGLLYGGSKLCLSESSVESPAIGVDSGAIYNSSSEDEDVCPTCLEEYTSENPRITMQCSHHFHLACIYEWMERSEACPVCGKVMLFNETT